jgi:SAM-dependent methyltransferase
MMDSAADADLYDAMIFAPDRAEIFSASGFFNVGYWEAETAGQEAACLALLSRLLDTVPPGARRVLDVGCGLGAGTREIRMRQAGAFVVGINVSTRQLAVCRYLAADCHFVCMDAARLGFTDGLFDSVLSVEAAFHIRTREAFLREAARVLRPGGRIALSDILLTDPSLLGEWMVPPENRVASIEDYSTLLAEAGFADAIVEDATRPCWAAFCEQRVRVLLDRASLVGGADGKAAAALADYFTHLGRAGLNHYVLASATKPAAATGTANSVRPRPPPTHRGA